MPEIDQNLPRVTEILAEAGLVDTTWFTPEGRDRGTSVHLCCLYHDEGTLDYSTVAPELEGYLRAYDAWKQDNGIVDFAWMEIPVSNGLYRGTPDRILWVRPRKLVDLKSGTYHPSHKWQLAAYVHLLPEPYSYSRLGVYLKSDGTYSVREFPKTEYQQDLNVFLAALTVVTAKRMNNLKRKGETNGNTNSRNRTDGVDVDQSGQVHPSGEPGRL